MVGQEDVINFAIGQFIFHLMFHVPFNFMELAPNDLENAFHIS